MLRERGVNVRLAKCLNSVLNVKAVVTAFNQEKALVGAFSVITILRMELFEALVAHQTDQEHHKVGVEVEVARPATEDMDAGEVA